jgi:hypothetical protein
VEERQLVDQRHAPGERDLLVDGPQLGMRAIEPGVERVVLELDLPPRRAAGHTPPVQPLGDVGADVAYGGAAERLPLAAARAVARVRSAGPLERGLELHELLVALRTELALQRVAVLEQRDRLVARHRDHDAGQPDGRQPGLGRPSGHRGDDLVRCASGGHVDELGEGPRGRQRVGLHAGEQADQPAGAGLEHLQHAGDLGGPGSELREARGASQTARSGTGSRAAEVGELRLGSVNSASGRAAAEPVFERVGEGPAASWSRPANRRAPAERDLALSRWR